MNLRSLSFGLLAVLFIPSVAHSATCESLKSLSLQDATITLARNVAAGEFSLSPTVQNGAQQNAAFKQLPAFCRVTVTLKPSADSDIKIEVWMPMTSWNGKFQAVGNGGWAGTISYTSSGAAANGGLGGMAGA